MLSAVGLPELMSKMWNITFRIRQLVRLQRLLTLM
jgi:hypothetical protein